MTVDPQWAADEAARLGLGATGKANPNSPLPDDAGELKSAVLQHEGQVVLLFGKPTPWVSMTPEGAAELGYVLIQAANRLQRQKPIR